MRKLKSLLQRPKNSLYLGLLVGFLMLASLIFPVIQMFPLVLSADLLLEYSDCGYCALTNLNIFFIVSICIWTIYTIYKVTTDKTYGPLQISLYMFVGYILTNNIIALTFEKNAMRSSDGLKYLFLLSTAPYASLLPLIYGLIFYLIRRKKETTLKKNFTPN